MKTMIARVVLPFGLLALLMMVMMVMMAPSAAFAEDPDDTEDTSANATTIITSTGTVAVTSAAINFGSTALGADQDQTASSATATWTVSNTRNLDTAFQVTLSATDFTSGTYSISADGFTVKVQQSSVISSSVNAVSGPVPNTNAADFQSMNGGGGQIILTSSGLAYPVGMGVYDFNPEFELLIPGLKTVVGTYTTTVIVTTSVGPR